MPGVQARMAPGGDAAGCRVNAAPAILLVVMVLIAVRRIGRWRIAIWQSMCGGAIAALATGAIAPAAALAAIDVDVIAFLVGTFVVGEALVASGALYWVAYKGLSRLRSVDALVAALLAGTGLASALLMNDTLAIVATPLALRLAREHRIDPRLPLLAVAFGVTTGSVMSPIGNPQNLLIALHAGYPAPFTVFAAALAIPTLASLVAAHLVLRACHRAEFHRTPLVHTGVEVTDRALAWLSAVATGVMLAGVTLKTVAAFGGELRLSWIALAAALPVLAASPRRFELLRRIDWPTIAFFAAMFVLMTAVWDAGLADRLQPLAASPGVATVLGAGVGISQIVSNVPAVALCLPLLAQGPHGEAAYMALAAGSTIAGNLLILGAASNVIVIQRAEREGANLSFAQFARAGVPLTAIQFGLYWAWLSLRY
ncbi:MAG: SLC13 family permease [Gammaproteobacteria bacterium]